MSKNFLMKGYFLVLVLFAVLACLQGAQLQGAPDNQTAEIQNVFIGPIGPPSYPIVPTTPRMPPGPPPPLPQAPGAQRNESSDVNSSLSETARPAGLPFGPLEYLRHLKDQAEKEAQERRTKALQEEEGNALEGI